MNTKNIGNIGEAIALQEFVKKGISVYIPFGENEKADLIADFDGKLNKIQVKTSQKIEDGKIIWRITSNCTSGVHKYTKQEVDYFVLYNIESDLLLIIPFSLVEGKTQVTFYVPFKQSTNQHKLLNYQDYLFDKIIK